MFSGPSPQHFNDLFAYQGEFEDYETVEPENAAYIGVQIDD
jgi:hypothetical protein